MKRLFLLAAMACGMLAGCGGETAISEVELKDVNEAAMNFMENVESSDPEGDTGIYVYNDSENQRYLYLSQDFLDEGRDFGDTEIQTDENSMAIYLNDIPSSEGEPAAYKVYKIDNAAGYEYVKVFKNGEETHFASIGI